MTGRWGGGGGGYEDTICRRAQGLQTILCQDSLHNVRDQQIIALSVDGCAGPANVRLPIPVIRYN